MTGNVKFALVGQPNVGKSSLFSRLTGVGVVSSNYPGTTVEFDEGTVTRNGNTVSVFDLPGTYSLSGNTDDERVVLRKIRDEDMDAVVIVADAADLEGSLVLCFEALELGLPSIVALNRMDIARKRYDVDIGRLESVLGVPVVGISSKTAEGVDLLADTVCLGRARVPDFRLEYDGTVEKAVTAIVDGLEGTDICFDPRGTALKLLEGSSEFTSGMDPDLMRSVGLMRRIYEEEYGEPVEVATHARRYDRAHEVHEECLSPREVEQSLSERISDMCITPITGVPILAAVCLAVVAVVVYGGSFLDGVVNGFYDAVIGTSIIDFGTGFGGFWGAVFTGIDGSLRAILALVIPYIMVFYLLLGILEDSGYLTRAVVLLDKLMHRFGLHGGAFIPMIVGIGCNVPAIMAVRTIRSHREKIILSSMIVMAVPCSAQIAIIMGTTGNYSGFVYAVGIFGLLVAIGALTGVLMNRFMRYEPTNLAMELPELVVPSPANILGKTWDRIKDFFTIAFPLLVVGSVVVEVLLMYDLLRFVVDPLSPITVGMLGLPAVCIISFIVGILRKEMAVGMLQILAGGVALSEFMTPDQFVVFGVVMAIYMPCIATLTTMWREMGWRETVAISLLSIAVALLFGTATNLLLSAF